MEQSKAAYSRRAFLKSSLLAGGGLMISFSVLPDLAIAEKAKAAGEEKVAFDRAGFAYHGRVKALADAAREAGLQF